MSTRIIPKQTLDAQILASDPKLSAWVSANAGSGKTHVLTQRVVRLLLNGVPPARILCLTFTKAAAANMSIRVFEKLAKWTRISDDELAAEIIGMGEPAPTASDLTFARRLFARTVETPGGLKIQTIHAFCEKLLHLFPFEANVAARFEVIEEERSKELLEQARRQTLEQALHDATSPLGLALQKLAQETSDSVFDDLIKAALGKQEIVTLAQEIDEGEGKNLFAQLLSQQLGLEGEGSVEAIDDEIAFGGFSDEKLRAIADVLNNGLSTDQKYAGRLLTIVATENLTLRARLYSNFFLDSKGAPQKKFLTKDLAEAHAGLVTQIENERDRVFPLLEKRRIAHTVARTKVLVAVVYAIISTYRREKEARGLLDFGDLIVATRKLLKRTEASWVLEKLDRGIDHILVDEAQDTSPEQWDILESIAEEFTAGRGQREVVRTFFAVGDEKQSIFSFQGARPDLFDAMRAKIERKTAGGEQRFEGIKLRSSFRSSPAIMAFVDHIFSVDANFEGLSADNLKTQHEALKLDLPGLVEIWPEVLPDPAAEPRDWKMPVDQLDLRDPAVVVARRIAKTIATWIAPGSPESVEDKESGGRRPIRPGDVMILVRNRNSFFDAIIRALKEARVPVAGADRLKLTQHIAVMDLIAAGRAALLPEDDLTLACVLKSPLLGLTEDDLLMLAPARGNQSLYDALAVSEIRAHQAAFARIENWRKWVKQDTPFFFYARLLGPERGRHDMLARLGPEAGDALDEFLRLALDHDMHEAPSLVAFLAQMDGSDLSIKRDMEAGTDAVRVMTVHASKGLEAKIVFLGDTCSMPSHHHDPKLLELGKDQPVFAWPPKRADEPQKLGEAREASRHAQMQEYRRLLYVAMTRAEERLYVTAFGKQAARDGCWYKMIAYTLAPDLMDVPAPWGEADARVLRRVTGDVAGLGARAAMAVTEEEMALPAWATTPAPHEALPARPLSPSNALNAADRLEPAPRDPGSFAEQAAQAGRLAHALLQYLPQVAPEARPQAAERFLTLRGATLDPDRCTRLQNEVLGVLALPGLDALFGPDSQAEVAVGGQIVLPDGKKLAISGQIDRLSVDANEVVIADFKTGTPHSGGAMPSAYLAQLAMYRAAVAPLYPDKAVRCILVWTEGPLAEDVDSAALDAALLDVARAHS
jgi:ATP-dependent helicase/nuclease subunit A